MRVRTAYVVLLLTACSGGGEGADEGGTNARVELPEGSREVEGVVNLVDADAAGALDQFLEGTSGLTLPTNLFLRHYEERYDFVFLFTDHEVPNATAVGRFVTVTSEPRPGTGVDSEYLAEGYQTDGRLKGTIGVQYGAAPFAHEVGHYWGVFLDSSFGFKPAHWGFTGVGGMLGGFDPATLVCESPSGAPPTDCEPTSDGRYRYVVGSFSPAGNVLPYAPFELYLMGLASAEEVPPQIPILHDAEEVPDSFDPTTRTEVVDATGFSLLDLADIQERHGVAAELALDARHFSSAFVVVSATPASDEVIAKVALQAAAFGDRGSHPSIDSFATETGGRATMDTLLGPRRAVSDTPPRPRAASSTEL